MRNAGRATGDDLVIGTETPINDRRRKQRRDRQRIRRHRRLKVRQHVQYLANAQPMLGQRAQQPAERHNAGQGAAGVHEHAKQVFEDVPEKRTAHAKVGDGSGLRGLSKSVGYTTRVHLKALTRHVLDFCYPGSCAFCEAACEGDVVLCESCRIDLAKLEHAAACDKCAMPIKEHGNPCPYCRGKGVPHYERILRLGIFVDPLKQLIHQMKYRRAWNLAEFLTDRLLDQEPIKTLMHETDVIVPVPLFFTRHISRGYNQAELIARRLAKACDKRMVKAITRVRPTETQTHLSATQREENMRN